MKNLFPNNFPWPFFFGFALILRLSFVDMSWYSYFAILLSLHQLILFFNSVGEIIPVRFMLGVFMCIQFFIGPTLAYNGLDKYQYHVYRMKIPEELYFSYALPAVICFILGLHIYSKNLSGERIKINEIETFVNKNQEIPYYFIAIGFLASITSVFFSSELAFVFYLLGSFKFVGLFLIVLGGREIKPLPLALVIGSIVSTSLVGGMFHDLLTWIIFTSCVYAIKYKFGFNFKLIGLGIFILLAVIVQQMKGVYRDALGSEAGGVETFTEVYKKSNEENSLFSYESLAESLVRINQGFIITNIMYNIPDKIPFENGAEMNRIFEAALLPRLIAPDKLRAGDREIFTYYSGIRLKAGTSMGLSSVGDAYINWGIVGGTFFMFLLAFSYSEILKLFDKNSKKYPVILIFTPLVFYYPIRPDCELQTILGHVVKSCFLIFVILTFWKDLFIKRNKLL